jgi:putative transposase
MHVSQRGNDRGVCFRTDDDRRLYLRCLADALTRNACALHAYVLMSNHVHLLITPSALGGVAATMQDLGRRYVRLFNDAHQRTGTLWEGRYKASPVDTESYLLACHRYIELNPVRAALAQHAAEYRWSSHRHYAMGIVDRLLTPHEIFIRLADDGPGRRHAFVRLFDQDLDGEVIDRIRSSTRQGWALGSDHFLDAVEAALGRSARPPKRGRPFKPAPSEPGEDQLMLI